MRVRKWATDPGYRNLVLSYIFANYLHIQEIHADFVGRSDGYSATFSANNSSAFLPMMAAMEHCFRVYGKCTMWTVGSRHPYGSNGQPSHQPLNIGPSPHKLYLVTVVVSTVLISAATVSKSGRSSETPKSASVYSFFNGRISGNIEIISPAQDMMKHADLCERL